MTLIIFPSDKINKSKSYKGKKKKNTLKRKSGLQVLYMKFVLSCTVQHDINALGI